jgi:hypothetical protein
MPISNSRDLQKRLDILALSAPFRICRLQILLAERETDSISGYHLQIVRDTANR